MINLSGKQDSVIGAIGTIGPDFVQNFATAVPLVTVIDRGEGTCSSLAAWVNLTDLAGAHGKVSIAGPIELHVNNIPLIVNKRSSHFSPAEHKQWVRVNSSPVFGLARACAAEMKARGWNRSVKIRSIPMCMVGPD